MSKLTDRISYLQGLAEGMKLNPEKDSNRLILEILDVLGEVGDSFEALAESHGELSDYVESIDEDLADLEADLYDDENEDLAEEEDGDFEEGLIEYECPHCGATVQIEIGSVEDIGVGKNEILISENALPTTSGTDFCHSASGLNLRVGTGLTRPSISAPNPPPVLTPLLRRSSPSTGRMLP